jgi:uncharacterized damage-inducible protein DinB
MQHVRRTLVWTMAASMISATALAQDTRAALRSELLGHFNESMGKVIALAEAMPPGQFNWRPEKDAMPVGQVYAHIARYNYYYTQSSLGVALPAGVRLDTLEAMRDKAQIVQLLRRSAEHAKLYGRTVPRWAVVLQLVAHMNEHLGQSIAYARSNSVVPPWSR